MTKPNETQRNDGKTQLTARQLKAIPLIVTSPTHTKGCKRAKVNRTTFYKWLKDPAFKAELDLQRRQIAAEAFGVLSQSLTKAVETLVGLLDSGDKRLGRLAAKDIIDFIIRHKENEELEQRIAEIEQKLDGQKQNCF